MTFYLCSIPVRRTSPVVSLLHSLYLQSNLMTGHSPTFGRSFFLIYAYENDVGVKILMVYAALGYGVYPCLLYRVKESQTTR